MKEEMTKEIMMLRCTYACIQRAAESIEVQEHAITIHNDRSETTKTQNIISTITVATNITSEL